MKMEKQKKWLKFKTNVEVNVRPVQRGGGGTPPLFDQMIGF